MSFCPTCKKEYNNDITICPECNVALTTSNVAETVSVFSLQKEDAAERFVSYMHEQGMEVTYEYSIREDAYKIYVEKSDVKKAVKMFATFYMMEARKKKAADQEAQKQAAAPAEAVPTTITPAEDAVEVSAVEEEIPITPSAVEEDSFEAISVDDAPSVPLEAIAPEPIVPEVETPSIEAPIVEEAPVVEAPIVEEAPVIEAPIVEEAPVIEAPIVEEAPVIDAPIVEEAPVIEAPIVEEAPVIEAPIVEEAPVIEAPTVEEAPVEEAPIVEDAPVMEAPIVEEIPVVKAPTIDVAPSVEPIEKPTPASEPIFVEVERVEESELDDNSIIDTSFVNKTPGRAKAPSTDSVPIKETKVEEPEDDAFSDFLTNFKRASLSKSQKMAQQSRQTPVKPTPVPTPAPTTKSPIIEEVVKPSVGTAEPVIEEIVPRNAGVHVDTSDYESIPSRQTDISDTKIKVTAESHIIEEVIDDKTNLEQPAVETEGSSSSFADPQKPSEAFAKKPVVHEQLKSFSKIEVDSLDGEYKGFVPDYSVNDISEKPLDPDAQAMEEFRKKAHARKEEQAKENALKNKEALRKASLVKDLGKGQKIQFEDTEELDNYAGFVPDYTPNVSNEEEFDFYKPRTVSSYSKYKKGKNGKEEEAPVAVSHMRQTSLDEIKDLFVSNVPAGVKKTIAANDLKSSSFIISMSGKQLTLLFNSWMMLNITSHSVKAFEVKDGSVDDNFNAKIEGIKGLLRNNFGDLNDGFLDAVVRKYYNKYLDD